MSESSAQRRRSCASVKMSNHPSAATAGDSKPQFYGFGVSRIRYSISVGDSIRASLDDHNKAVAALRLQAADVHMPLDETIPPEQIDG